MKKSYLVIAALFASVVCYGQVPALPPVPPPSLVNAAESLIMSAPDKTELGTGTGCVYAGRKFDYGADIHVGYSFLKVTSKANNLWSTGISSETICGAKSTTECLAIYESVSLLQKPAGVTPTKLRDMLTGSKGFVAVGTPVDKWGIAIVGGISFPF